MGNEHDGPASVSLCQTREALAGGYFLITSAILTRRSGIS